MTDRELLELAALACGELQGEWIGNQNYFDGVLSRWNPLTDDGDALRLAVALNLEGFRIGSNSSWVEGFPVSQVFHRGDPYAATRRAIVRAAAEIGKAML